MNFLIQSVGDILKIGEYVELRIAAIMENGDVQFEIIAPEYILTAIKQNNTDYIEKYIEPEYHSLLLGS